MSGQNGSTPPKKSPISLTTISTKSSIHWRSTTFNEFCGLGADREARRLPGLGEGDQERAPSSGWSSPHRRSRVRWPWQRRMRATVGAVLVDLAEQRPVRNDAQLSPAVTVCVVLKSIQGGKDPNPGHPLFRFGLRIGSSLRSPRALPWRCGGDDPGIAGIALVFGSTVSALPPSGRTGRSTRNRTAQQLQPCPTRALQRTSTIPAAAFHYSKTLKSEYRKPLQKGCV